MKSHRDLIVWQKSIDLVEHVYRLSAKLPDNEKFNLRTQVERAVVSIPSNIAEGARRRHKLEFLQFLSISNGSAGELETQLIIIGRLYPKLKGECDQCLAETEEILKMLYSLADSIEKK